ncbi:MAG TPA: hypothetical protein VII92_14685, partial [Anaerolineae bacterium]
VDRRRRAVVAPIDRAGTPAIGGWPACQSLLSRRGPLALFVSPTSQRQFTRSGYPLLRLKLGADLTHVVRGVAKRLIAPPQEVLALKPEWHA